LLAGHTRDDQAETCAIRAAAGSGAYGLAGMQPLAVAPGFASGAAAILARPLLTTPRAAFRAYLETIGAGWSEDPSNADIRFERVRVRRDLADSPELAEHLLAAAQAYSVQRRIADGVLGQWFQTGLAFDDAAITFAALPVPDETAARALGWLIQLVTERDTPPRSEALVSLARRIAHAPSFRGATLGGARFRVKSGQIRLTPETGAHPSGATLNARRLRLSEVLRACAVTDLSG
jgi:tRNA(Ile)-lysidine synthase